MRAGRPQHGKKQVRKEGLEGGVGWQPAAREEARKEVRAGRPQQGKKPRVPRKRLEEGAGWPPAAQEEARSPEGAGWQPAAREEAKSQERRVGRRSGLAARSTGRSQESQRRVGRRCGLAARSTGRSKSRKKGWKEVRHGRPHQGKKPSAGWTPAAREEAKSPERRVGRRCGPRREKKPRVRKEGLEGGAGWAPAAREEAKSAERRVGTGCGLAARSSTGRSQETWGRCRVLKEATDTR